MCIVLDYALRLFRALFVFGSRRSLLVRLGGIGHAAVDARPS